MAIRAILKAKARELECPGVEGQRTKTGERDRERLACLHNSARTCLSSWSLGMPLRCQRSLGSVPHENALYRASGCISPTCLLSSPCTLNALCSCPQLPNGTHGSAGAAWSLLPRTCVAPTCPCWMTPPWAAQPCDGVARAVPTAETVTSGSRASWVFPLQERQGAEREEGWPRSPNSEDCPPPGPYSCERNPTGLCVASR